jgi:hypothetical protein
METTKQKCIYYFTNKGMFQSQAEQVLESAKPHLEVGGYRITWDRPAAEYPDELYAVMFMILKRSALEWIDANVPHAWFRELFL